LIQNKGSAIMLDYLSFRRKPVSNPQTLSFQRTIAAPPAELYRALTRSTHLREWLCDSAQSLVRANGHLFLAWNDGYTASGRYTTLVPGEEIGFTWQGQGDPAASQVHITITPANGGSQLSLEHSNIPEGPAVAEMQRGWESSLENLQSVMETGDDLRLVRRPMLGVFIGEFTPAIAEKLGVPVQEGVRLEGTAEGLGARAAGLQPDDVIVAIAGRTVTDWPSLTSTLQTHRAGDRVQVEYYRGGEKMSTVMELSARRLPTVPDTAQELAGTIGRNYARSDAALDDLIASVSEEEADHRPAAEEWSVKEVLAHLIAGERENHTWIADMFMGAERLSDDYDNTTNIQPRLQGIIAVYPTLPELVAELKRSEQETVATIAHLSADFAARKSSYVRLGRQILSADEGHAQTHFEQIQAAITAART
jgi:uncharacterized protein YndB with AHSA1/START domain